MNTRTARGLTLAFAAAGISGLAVFINGYGVRAVRDATVYTTAKNLMAAAVLVVGVFRRWRWTFWLVLIAFLFGVLRLPASALQLAGMMPASAPTWYEALQGVIGVVQFLIAIAMVAGYRKAGVWGEF